MHFICPLCQQPLSLNTQGLACPDGHHFDRAREGYFNLLPAQHKNSREPGDARIQLLARRAFLNEGHFAPLLPGLMQCIPATTNTLLDVGCGEGYFTSAMRQHLCPAAAVYAIDIAKTGVKLAAKSYPGNYAVASSFALPIAQHSMEIVTRIYAPSDDGELRRVLAPGGKVIVIAPGVQHLIGLRHLIYSDVRPHPPPKALAGMELLDSFGVDFQLQLPAGEAMLALLQMTPFAWRISESLKQRLVGEGMQDRADFQLSVYTPEQ